MYSPTFRFLNDKLHALAPGDDTMNYFLQNLFTRHFKKNDFIKHANKEDVYLNIIQKGSAGLFVNNGRHSTCISLFYEGDFCCDYLSILKKEKTPLQIIALEDAEVLSISYEKITSMHEKHPISIQMSKSIAEQLYINKQEEMIRLLTLKPEERYRKLIKERPDVLLRTPLKVISSYLGVTPESFSRLRKKCVGKNSRNRNAD